MSISKEIRELVRQRAGCAYEFCGVSETDTGGELTLDHYHPHTKGGTDGLENLLYCCTRYNLYKHDYFPSTSSDPGHRRILDIIHLLEEKGASVVYHDPHVPAFQHEGMEMAGATDLDDELRRADCVVIVTDHSDYDWAQISAKARLLVDTRHVIANVRSEPATNRK